MNGRVLIGLILAGAAALAVALGWSMHVANSRRIMLEQLVKQRDEVCTRLQWDLEAMIRNPQMRQDLRARIQHHHLDEGLTQLCLDNPIPIDTHDADLRWIASHDENVYLDVARALLEKYRSRNSGR